MAARATHHDGPMVAFRLGLVVHPTRDVAASVGQVAAWAAAHDVEVVGDRAASARLPAPVRPVDAAELATTCDALVSLGGDGTMLGALRMVVQRPVPVLGVNLGNLGFLVEVDPPELPAALARLAAKEFTLEPHPCLRITVDGAEHVAFNDLALVRTPGTGMVGASLSVEGRRYGHYRADAVVVATPSGSTAYSYAAGGPVVSPAADVLLVTPSAPAQGVARPLVIAGEERLELGLLPDSGAVSLEVDGTLVGTLPPDGRITVRRQREAGQVVRLDAHAHQGIRTLKLSLLDLPLLPEELRQLIPGDVTEARERYRSSL